MCHRVSFRHELARTAQHIFARVQDNGKSSIRRIAAATGIAKSAVHRHLQALNAATSAQNLLGKPQPVSSGVKLVLAMYVFGIKKRVAAKRSQHSSICCI